MDDVSSNPIVAALVWIFHQLISDPDILKKIFTVVAAAAILRLLIALYSVIQTARRKKWREQYERAFSSQQRMDGFVRARGRCEFDNGLLRCKNKAEHADHFYPWALGGATSMRNLVAACSGHNLAKGAKMPSVALKSRIETRRRSYFPASEDITAGEWSVRHQA